MRQRAGGTLYDVSGARLLYEVLASLKGYPASPDYTTRAICKQKGGKEMTKKTTERKPIKYVTSMLRIGYCPYCKVGGNLGLQCLLLPQAKGKLVCTEQDFYNCPLTQGG